MDEQRRQRIAEARLRQPIEELDRKAAKAATRARLWTQEELDCADVRARALWKSFGWDDR
jgi:hypothetical protein